MHFNFQHGIESSKYYYYPFSIFFKNVDGIAVLPFPDIRVYASYARDEHQLTIIKGRARASFRLPGSKHNDF